MLAQNFKTAAELGFNDCELAAAIRLLGMLERGEIHHDPESRGYAEWPQTAEPKTFNMGSVYGEGSCGTSACMLGWIESLSNQPVKSLHSKIHLFTKPGLYRLFYTQTHCQSTPAQAAIALRNYLTTGEPKWDEALTG